MGIAGGPRQGDRRSRPGDPARSPRGGGVRHPGRGAYNGRAWLRATSPVAAHRDGRQAVASATRACELSDWKEASHLGTLAAASAEAGDFHAAVKWQEKALELLSDREQGRRHLELYRSKQPSHKKARAR